MNQKKADPVRGGGERPADDPSSERAFDRWLNRQLHGLYDPVLSEAVPDEIMRLVERFDERPARPGTGERGRDES